MSVDYDEEMAIDLQIECARQDDRDGPFAGEDPPEDYLAELAAREYRDHCERRHGGGDCDCPALPVTYDTEAPF